MLMVTLELMSDEGDGNGKSARTEALYLSPWTFSDFVVNLS
jgi:hypothetical protein